MRDVRQWFDSYGDDHRDDHDHRDADPSELDQAPAPPLRGGLRRFGGPALIARLLAALLAGGILGVLACGVLGCHTRFIQIFA